MKITSKCILAVVAFVGFNSKADAFTAPQAFGGRVITSLGVTTLDQWQILDNGSVVGAVKGHPTLDDGDIVTTSPLENPNIVEANAVVATMTGSQYKLGTPMEVRQLSSTSEDEPSLGRSTLIKGAGLASILAGGVTLGFGLGAGMGGEGNKMSVPEVGSKWLSLLEVFNLCLI